MSMLSSSSRGIVSAPFAAALGMCFAIGLASCGGSSLPSGPSGNGSVLVAGRVLDFTSGAGIAGIAVAYGDRGTTSAANGAYTVDVPGPGAYDVRIDGALLGSNRVTRGAYRGDLLAHGGSCVSRYGTLADASTGNPRAPPSRWPG